MTTMVDYKSWFDNIDFDLDDRFDEIHSLYHAVKENDPSYGVSIQNVNGQIVVRYPTDAGVELSMPEEKRDEFVAYLDSMYELTVDGEYALRKAMERND